LPGLLTGVPKHEQQVESQIKVRDLSAAKLTISPAGHSSWSEARTDLVSERKTKLRAELEAELGATTDESEIEALRTSFNAKERSIETEVDNTVYTFSATLDIVWLKISNSSPTRDSLSPFKNTQRLTTERIDSGSHTGLQLLVEVDAAAKARSSVRQSGTHTNIKLLSLSPGKQKKEDTFP
jgi:hypothetical protein